MGRSEDGLALIRRAIAILPSAGPFYGNLGVILAETGKPQEAIDVYQQALALDPDSIDVLNNLATLARLHDRLNDAIPAQKRLTDLRPREPVPWNDLGTCSANWARTKKPPTPTAGLWNSTRVRCHHHNLASLLVRKKDIAGAIEGYRRAISIKPDFAEAYFRLGNLLAEENRLDEAAAALGQATILDRANAPYWYNFAHTLDRQGQKQQAIDAYRKATDAKPDYAAAYTNLGSVLQDLERHGEAEAVYRKALTIRPDSPELWCNRTALQKPSRSPKNPSNATGGPLSFARSSPRHSTISAMHRPKGNLLEARDNYLRHALDIKLEFAEAYNSLGNHPLPGQRTAPGRRRLRKSPFDQARLRRSPSQPRHDPSRPGRF